MKTNRYLLPNYFGRIGWILSLPSAVVLLVYLFGKPWDAIPADSFFKLEIWHKVLNVFGGDSILAAICMVLLSVGLLFVAFSREKIEDEYITKLRGDSLIWAVVANTILMAVLYVLVYGGWFLYVSLFNLYMVLVLFIIKFRVTLNRFKKESCNEE